MSGGRGFDADTRKSIGYLLRDTSRRILNGLTALLEPHGITLPQYFVLRELWQEEGLTQREVANRVGVLEPTMVTTLDALARLGMIVRVRSTTDRRKTHVQLTPPGVRCAIRCMATRERCSIARWPGSPMTRLQCCGACCRRSRPTSSEGDDWMTRVACLLLAAALCVVVPTGAAPPPHRPAPRSSFR